MLYVKVDMETNLALEFPIFEKDLRNKHLKGTTLPNVISDFSLVGTPYRCVEPKSLKSLNLVPTLTHSIEAVDAIYNEDTGQYDRVYGLVQVPEAKIERRRDYRILELRNARKQAFAKMDAKFLRNASEVRLGITPTDNIEDLDAKAQELRDVTNLDNLWAIELFEFFDV
tara:strand:- start:1253 stop:1762 length:510 start_codon:yes stop_codon:yes gene_type:complete